MIPTLECPVCGRGREHATGGQFERRGISYMSCPCGMYYADQYMDENEVRAYYAGGDYRVRHHGGCGGDRFELEHAAVLVPMITKEIHACDAILDIGCSTGLLLKKLRDHYRCTVHGMEWAKVQREQCIRGGIKCFEDFSEIQDKYSLVILSHVLEHTLYPLELLGSIREILKGELFIQVPIMMATYPHPLMFTEATAVMTIEKAGYSIISTDDTKHFTVWAKAADA